MRHYPYSVPAHVKATIYGELPTHGRAALACVFHTTETRGLPWYSGGDVAPHYTYDTRTRIFHEHASPDLGYVGTMKGHSTGGHGNCKAIQLEIVAYSSREGADESGGLHVSEFSDDHFKDLSHFWGWVRDTWGLEDRLFGPPAGGRFMYGTSSPYRMSPEEWEEFSGLTAHGAVPLNSHWDTGELDLLRIWTQARRLGMPYAQFKRFVDALFTARPDEFKGDPSYFYRSSHELDANGNGGIYDLDDNEDWDNFWNAAARAMTPS